MVFIFSTTTAYGVQITTEFPDALRTVTQIFLSLFDGSVRIITIIVYDV